MQTQIARGPGQAIIAMGKKLNPGEQKALQVVAGQAPLDQRITATSARVTGARDAAARTRQQADPDQLRSLRIRTGKVVRFRTTFLGGTPGSSLATALCHPFACFVFDGRPFSAGRRRSVPNPYPNVR